MYVGGADTRVCGAETRLGAFFRQRSVDRRVPADPSHRQCRKTLLFAESSSTLSGCRSRKRFSDPRIAVTALAKKSKIPLSPIPPITCRPFPVSKSRLAVRSPPRHSVIFKPEISPNSKTNLDLYEPQTTPCRRAPTTKGRPQSRFPHPASSNSLYIRRSSHAVAGHRRRNPRTRTPIPLALLHLPSSTRRQSSQRTTLHRPHHTRGPRHLLSKPHHPRPRSSQRCLPTPLNRRPQWLRSVKSRARRRTRSLH